MPRGPRSELSLQSGAEESSGSAKADGRDDVVFVTLLWMRQLGIIHERAFFVHSFLFLRKKEIYTPVRERGD